MEKVVFLIIRSALSSICNPLRYYEKGFLLVSSSTLVHYSQILKCFSFGLRKMENNLMNVKICVRLFFSLGI